MRIFLDANVLFSAARSDGAMHELLRLLIDSGHELQADTYVVEEARRNLAAKASGAEVPLEEILATVAVAAFVTDHGLEKKLSLSKEDRPVLAAAIRLKCEILVTGDRTHFGEFYGKSLRGVTIHYSRSLAEAVFGSRTIGKS